MWARPPSRRTRHLASCSACRARRSRSAPSSMFWHHRRSRACWLQSPTRLEGPVSSDKTTKTPATILIAEDSATQAQELSFLLEEHGFEVRAAQNGRLALEAARQQVPDLIISDIVMPEMDGYTFCRSVKSDPKLNQVPFILVTSLSTPHDVFKGLDVGADN